MEKESMMEIEVMEDAFNLNGTEEETELTAAPDTEADVTEEEIAGCDCETADEECTCTKKQVLKEKCAQVSAACKKTAGRLKNNWKSCGCNADVRASATYKLELFKKGETETPVDTYSAEKSVTFSLRTVAIVGASAIALGICVGKIAKLFDK